MGNCEEAVPQPPKSITHLTPRGKALELDRYQVKTLYFIILRKNSILRKNAVFFLVFLEGS